MYKYLNETNLFVALKYYAFEWVRAAISCNIAKYFEIAAIMWNVEYPINRMVHHFNVISVVGPLFFLLWAANRQTCNGTNIHSNGNMQKKESEKKKWKNMHTKKIFNYFNLGKVYV